MSLRSRRLLEGIPTACSAWRLPTRNYVHTCKLAMHLPSGFCRMAADA